MDLVAAVADGTELSRAKASEVVDAVFNAISDALKNKEEVRLVGFGTFVAAVRKASTGRNPRTGEDTVSGFWAVSSAVERLVYTERVGGSIPSPPTTAKAVRRVRGASRL